MESSSTVSSPLGTLRVTASPRGIMSIELGGRKVQKHSGSQSRVLEDCEAQMGEYLAGRRQSFDLRFDLRGTPFQKRVWAALAAIPFGQTVTYGQIARQIGRPTAVRAVGTAVGKNPVAILLPCHRVVPSSGKLPGQYAWGKARKKWLLRHEHGFSGVNE